MIIMKKQHNNIAVLAAAAALLILPGAAEADVPAAHTSLSSTPQDMQMHMGTGDVYEEDADERRAEIQLDYLEHRGQRRHIDLYNLHAFRQYKEMHDMTLHWGLTLSRPVGSWAEKDRPDTELDSSAVGAGPAYMVRFTRPLGTHWEASFDVTGAVLVYNRVHPAHTRNYGFLWRVGPRLTYKFNDSNALSVAFLGHHVSNGQKTSNPGYNGVGFSIGYRYSY
jgi:hypothetical protein